MPYKFDKSDQLFEIFSEEYSQLVEIINKYLNNKKRESGDVEQDFVNFFKCASSSFSSKLKNNSYRVTFVEGNIAIGKSTLLANFNKHIVVDEPLSIWQNIKNEDDVCIFEHFYQCQSELSSPLVFVFQILALFSRVANLVLKALKLNTILQEQQVDDSIVQKIRLLAERSIYSDKYILVFLVFNKMAIIFFFLL